MGFFGEGINVYSTTGPNLLDTTKCPPGTHDSLDSATCWPVSTTVDVVAVVPNGPFLDKPHMRVDEAATGSHIGAGNVYVTYTAFGVIPFTASAIELVACTNDLSICQLPEPISAPPDLDTHFSHLDVRPDGSLAITYVNITLVNPNTSREREMFTIRYVACVPGPNGAATGAPICSAPQTVLTDANTIPRASVPTLSGEGFRVSTYPKHDYQVALNGHVWEYIVWDRCKVPPIFGVACPDSDVLAVAADTGTLGGSIAAPTWSHVFAVAATPGKHDFQPWIRTDGSRNIVNIAYYSNFGDTYNHRPVMVYRQIPPCTPTLATGCLTSIGLATDVFTSVDEPQGDNVSFLFEPGFGDYQGVAARGTGPGASRSYFGYTANFRVGLTEGIAVPDEDNYISSFTY